MKAPIKVLLAVLAIGLFCLPASAQNLLLNPGFEDWDDNGTGGPPDDWDFSVSTNYSALQETGTIHEGTYSTKIEWSNTSTSYFQQKVAVTPGNNYTFEYYILDNDTGVRTRPWFTWRPTGSSGPGTYTEDSGDWQVAGWTDLAPVDAESLIVQIRLYDISGWTPPGVVYVDEASLYVPTANIPPTIGTVYAYPYPLAFGDVWIEAQITDSDGTIADDSLYYQTSAVPGYVPVYHDSIVGDYYWYTIPSQTPGTFVEYYVQAEDDGAERIESSVFDYTVQTNGPTGSGLNFDFEDWDDNGVGGPPDDWFKTTDDFTATQEGTTVHGGTYSNNLTWTSTNTQNLTSNPIYITGGQTYACSLYVYDNDPYGRVRVIFRSDGCSSYPSTYSTDFEGWQKLEYLWMAPENATWVEVQLNMYDVSGFTTDATVYVDDVYLTETAVVPETLSVYEVQFSEDPGVPPGDCYPSPELDNIVSVNGIVTAVKFNDPSNNRFYFQDADSLWSGMFAFQPTLPSTDPYVPVIGDSITVTGTIAEYYTVTEDYQPTVTVHGTGTVFDPIVVTSDDIPPDTCDVVGESYESMLVTLENVLCVVATSGSEAWVKSDGATDSCVISSYIFGPPPTPIFVAGQRYNVTGIVSYFTYRFVLYPRSADDVEIIPPEEPVIGPVVQDPPGTLIDPSISVVVTAGIVDYQGTIDDDGIAIRLNGGSWTNYGHTSVEPPTYTYTIGTNVEGTFVEYYIFATDNDDNTAATQIYSYTATSYTPTCADEISAIQTTTTTPGWPECYPSPSDGLAANICGIATGVKKGATGSGTEAKFFIQADDADLWNAVYVYDPVYALATPITDGDEVEVFGTVDEYNGLTEITSITDVRKISSGNAGPDPLDAKIREFESDCSFATEPYEGVLVKFEGVTITSGSGGYFWINDTTSTDSVQITNYLYYAYLDCAPNPPLEIAAYYDSVFGCMYWYGSYSDPDAGFWRLYPRCGTDFYSDMEPIGACCVEAVCVATNSEAECAALTGEWFIGESCPEFECPALCYEYLPGDVNMSVGLWPPAATGPDVTYLVNYFRSAPTSVACKFDGDIGLFWASADANGDCNIIGSDVTKMINVFRQIGSMKYCGDQETDPGNYEPCWPTVQSPWPPKPDGWPNCE